MKGIKKIINFVIVLSLVMGCLVTTNSVATKAKSIGQGSVYRYNAPSIYLGDSVYCELDDEYYYKLNVYNDTYVKLYGRTYDSSMGLACELLNSSGNYINSYYSDEKENWGYDILNKTIYLRKGTYYLGIYGTGFSDDNDYVYLSVDATTVTKQTPKKKTNKKNVWRNTTKKKFSVSKKRITVKKGRRKKVTVTLRYNSGSVYYKIKNARKVSAKWGRWHGDKVKLSIKGKKRGRTKIIITNSKNSKRYVIKVRVK